MPRNIVVLDGLTLNPGDLTWEPIAKHGKLTVHDRTDTAQIIDRAGDAEIVFTNKTPLSANTLDQLPKLKYIGVLATGYNVVDLAAAAERGAVVTNIPTYGTDSVAQHTIAMMLELARGIGAHDRAVHEGQWTTCPDFCFAVTPIVELTGKTLAVIGMGRIGLAVAKIAAAMGMHVIAFDQYPLPPDKLQGLAVEYVTLERAFAQADVITLHCPLTKENHHLVNAARLATMKPTAMIINTSRGPLIDPDALAAALHNDKLAGAALDVLEVEPPAADNPLFKAPRCVITPHVAWYARQARQRLMDIAGDNLAAFLKGSPVNVVKPN